MSSEFRHVVAAYEHPLQETIYETSSNLITKAIVPKWVFKLDLTKRLRKTRIAFEHLEVRFSLLRDETAEVKLFILRQKYMLAMIHERRTAEVKSERNDLLSGLTDASEESVGGYEKLTDMEVISESGISGFLMSILTQSEMTL